MKQLQPLLVMAIVFCLFAFFGLAQSGQPGHSYRAETATELNGNSVYDDTLFLKAGLPCTTEVFDLGHYHTLVVTAYDTLAWLANDEDSCLYRVIFLLQIEASAGTFADTTYTGFTRIDSTVLYKTVQIAAGSTYVHTRKIFSEVADLELGEKAYFIVEPHANCDSCLVQVGYFLQE